MKIRIGTRGSDLALWQARHVASRLAAAGHVPEITVLETRGDRIDDVPLQSVEGLSLGADVPFFLFVGKMTPRRNVPLLLSAFADFKRKNPALPHRLLVVGLNTVHLDLPALSRELLLGEDFAHREYVSDEDLHLLYNAAEAFVLPYSYEALSLTTMEAQANGLPVITVDAPGLREVTGGKAILLPPPLTTAAVCEAMTRIATDGALRRRLAEEGLDFIRQFSWRRTSRETLAVLEEAAQAAGA